MDREKGVESVGISCGESSWEEVIGACGVGVDTKFPLSSNYSCWGERSATPPYKIQFQTPNPKKINNGHLYCFLFSSTFFTYLSPPDFTVIVWLIWLWKLTTHSPVDSCGRRWNYNYWDLSEWVFWSFTTVMLLSEFVLNSEKSENFLPFPEWKCRPS